MSGMFKTSSTQLQARRQYLNDFDTFLNKCQADVVCMLDTLEWTPDHFIHVKRTGVCPYNPGHRMSRECLDKHTRVCEYTSRVYPGGRDKELINSVLWNHHMKQNSVYYGHNETPLTVSQEEGMLSREDRLGLSEYVVHRARDANKLRELGPDELQAADNMADTKNNDERQLTQVEEMAALRDFRRRRQTYRAKNVHITKKSHIEIMREVITNQMEMFAQSVKDAATDTQVPHSEKQTDQGKQDGSRGASPADSYRQSADRPNREGGGDKGGGSRYSEKQTDQGKRDGRRGASPADSYRQSADQPNREGGGDKGGGSRYSEKQTDQGKRDGRRGASPADSYRQSADRPNREGGGDKGGGSRYSEKRADDGNGDRSHNDQPRREGSQYYRSRSRRSQSRSRSRSSTKRAKRSRSRSRQSGRSPSRERHRSKQHKKHKKQKRKHRHRETRDLESRDQSATDADAGTVVSTPVHTPSDNDHTEKL